MRGITSLQRAGQAGKRSVITALPSACSQPSLVLLGADLVMPFIALCTLPESGL
jgi:hypothetical protein